MDKIKFNDILQLTDLENVKIRFNLMFGGDCVSIPKNSTV